MAQAGTLVGWCPEPTPFTDARAASGQRGPALTAGFRPSLSRVFLLRGPSMVGTAAELPSVQVHGPVGLRGQHWSDIAQRSSAHAPCHSLGPTGPSLPSPHAATGRRTQQCWARPGREGLRPQRAHPPLEPHLPHLSECCKALGLVSKFPVTQAPSSTHPPS